MKKRILSLALSLVLAIGAVAISVPVTSYAVTDTALAKNCSSYAMVLGTNVWYVANFASVPASDDGNIYVCEMKTYEYELGNTTVPIMAIPATANIDVKFPLNYVPGVMGRLYNKFVLAVIRNGEIVMINEPQYITNPEAVAKSSKPRKERPVKALQEKNVANIFMDGVATPSEANVGAFHGVFSVDSPTVIVADATCEQADTHPVKNNPIAGYMMNANDDIGVQGLITEMTNYAANSNIQDFVIGNEVNERCWNYMPWVDWDTYVRRYVQVFRVCYTAIKATNPNAMVYTSLDQVWNKNPKGKDYYEYIDGDEFLAKFNSMINAGGNIDWNMSIHPYPNPLFYAKFWDLSGVANGATYKAQVAKNQVITFQNMSVLTNVLQQTAYLNRYGKVRDVIIGEIGMGTNAGGESQAAGVCASYAAFEMNPYVTQYLYLEVDINGFFPTLVGKGKEAFEAMGTANEQQYMDWAKNYIGITDWSEVIR